MPLTATGGSKLGAALFPSGSDVYIALYADAECTQELDVDGYARVAYEGWTTAGDGMSRSNSSAITWAPFTAGGLFRGLAVTDAATEGNQLATMSVLTLLDDPSVVVDAGDFPKIGAGALKVEIS